MAQRLFCCRSAREARRAIICSIVVVGVIFLVALVGIGLFAYYREHALTGEALALVSEKQDRIFPVFIVDPFLGCRCSGERSRNRLVGAAPAGAECHRGAVPADEVTKGTSHARRVPPSIRTSARHPPRAAARRSRSRR